MVSGVSTEALIAHSDERPTGVVGVRQGVCNTSRHVIGCCRPRRSSARTMELLATGVPDLVADHAFTIGLFSMLPSLVNRPMEPTLEGLGLPAGVEAALLDGRPPYGALLDRMICHLGGDFTARADDGPLTVERLDGAYRGALEWVEALRADVDRSA
jgi:hypothetical protein